MNFGLVEGRRQENHQKAPYLVGKVPLVFLDHVASNINHHRWLAKHLSAEVIIILGYLSDPHICRIQKIPNFLSNVLSEQTFTYMGCPSSDMWISWNIPIGRVSYFFSSSSSGKLAPGIIFHLTAEKLPCVHYPSQQTVRTGKSSSRTSVCAPPPAPPYWPPGFLCSPVTRHSLIS